MEFGGQREYIGTQVLAVRRRHVDVFALAAKRQWQRHDARLSTLGVGLLQLGRIVSRQARERRHCVKYECSARGSKNKKRSCKGLVSGSREDR